MADQLGMCKLCGRVVLPTGMQVGGREDCQHDFNFKAPEPVPRQSSVIVYPSQQEFVAKLDLDKNEGFVRECLDKQNTDLEKLETNKEACLEKITRKFEELEQRAAERRQALEEEVEARYDERAQLINGILDQLNEQESRIQAVRKEFDERNIREEQSDERTKENVGAIKSAIGLTPKVRNIPVELDVSFSTFASCLKSTEKVGAVKVVDVHSATEVYPSGTQAPPPVIKVPGVTIKPSFDRHKSEVVVSYELRFPKPAGSAARGRRLGHDEMKDLDDGAEQRVVSTNLDLEVQCLERDEDAEGSATADVVDWDSHSVTKRVSVAATSKNRRSGEVILDHGFSLGVHVSIRARVLYDLSHERRADAAARKGPRRVFGKWSPVAVVEIEKDTEPLLQSIRVRFKDQERSLEIPVAQLTISAVKSRVCEEFHLANRRVVLDLCKDGDERVLKKNVEDDTLLPLGPGFFFNATDSLAMSQLVFKAKLNTDAAVRKVVVKGVVNMDSVRQKVRSRLKIAGDRQFAMTLEGRELRQDDDLQLLAEAPASVTLAVALT